MCYNAVSNIFTLLNIHFISAYVTAASIYVCANASVSSANFHPRTLYQRFATPLPIFPRWWGLIAVWVRVSLRAVFRIVAVFESS